MGYWGRGRQGEMSRAQPVHSKEWRVGAGGGCKGSFWSELGDGGQGGARLGSGFNCTSLLQLVSVCGSQKGQGWARKCMGEGE